MSRVLPDGVDLIDFYPAAEPLDDAFDTAHGADAPKAVARLERYRHRLRHEPNGVHMKSNAGG